MKQEATFTLTISKVDEILFNGEAVLVTLPGLKGQLTILANHEPLIGLLTTGTVTIRTPDQTIELKVEKGIIETSNGQVTVLV